jgi:hypothetical protein
MGTPKGFWTEADIEEHARDVAMVAELPLCDVDRAVKDLARQRLPPAALNVWEGFLHLTGREQMKFADIFELYYFVHPFIERCVTLSAEAEAIGRKKGRRGPTKAIRERNREAKKLKESDPRLSWPDIARRLLREHNRPEWWPKDGRVFRAAQQGVDPVVKTLERIGNYISKGVADMTKDGRE